MTDRLPLHVQTLLVEVCLHHNQTCSTAMLSGEKGAGCGANCWLCLVTAVCTHCRHNRGLLYYKQVSSCPTQGICADQTKPYIATLRLTMVSQQGSALLLDDKATCKQRMKRHHWTFWGQGLFWARNPDLVSVFVFVPWRTSQLCASLCVRPIDVPVTMSFW